jgi:hypothetical protein
MNLKYRLLRFFARWPGRSTDFQQTQPAGADSSTTFTILLFIGWEEAAEHDRCNIPYRPISLIF